MTVIFASGKSGYGIFRLRSRARVFHLVLARDADVFAGNLDEGAVGQGGQIVPGVPGAAGAFPGIPVVLAKFWSDIPDVR